MWKAREWVQPGERDVDSCNMGKEIHLYNRLKIINTSIAVCSIQAKTGFWGGPHGCLVVATRIKVQLGMWGTFSFTQSAIAANLPKADASAVYAAKRPMTIPFFSLHHIVKLRTFPGLITRLT